MKHPVEQVGWIVIGLLLGGLIAYSTNVLSEPIVSEQTVTSNGTQTTTVKSPPPSAIAPQFSAGNGNELCTVGYSAAIQTQILGISGGGTYTEEGCTLRRNAKALYDMGMKVAAVSLLCTDPLIWQAMADAGTWCPHTGSISDEAKLKWESDTVRQPKPKSMEDEENAADKRNKALAIIGGIFGTALLF